MMSGEDAVGRRLQRALSKESWDRLSSQERRHLVDLEAELDGVAEQLERAMGEIASLRARARELATHLAAAKGSGRTPAPAVSRPRPVARPASPPPKARRTPKPDQRVPSTFRASDDLDEKTERLGVTGVRRPEVTPGRAVRKGVVLQATLTWGPGESATGLTENMSASGLFVCTWNAPPVGTRVAVEISGSSEQVRCDGVVARHGTGSQGVGCAVRFEELKPRQAAAVDALLARLSKVS